MSARTLSRGEVKVQVNLLIPLKWKEKLDDLARQQSVALQKTITYQGLIRETLDKHLNLSD